MTWKEFKQLVESQGVSDDSKILFIDTTRAARGERELSVYHGEKGFEIE